MLNEKTKERLLNFAVDTVNRIDPLRLLVSKLVINGYANRVPPRPRPLSMRSDFVTWAGLTDRRYSGRHLPPAVGDAAPAQPDLDEVAKLFERTSGTVYATDTTLLFPYFAQWFTDGFLRTKFEPGDTPTFRENESNHDIDLNQVYGSTEAQTDTLREGEGGRLKSQTINGEEYPPPLFEERDGKLELAFPDLYTKANFERVFGSWSDEAKRHAFAVGLEHGNATLGQTAMNTLFWREHNRIAGILAKAYPGWDDERLFQTARNVNIVVLLGIVIGDYIAHIAPLGIRLQAVPGVAERQRWYRSNWIAVEFALLYRWHDLIPDHFELNGETLPAEKMRLANHRLIEAGLGQVLLDASLQRAGRIGLGNTARFLNAKNSEGGADVKRLSVRMGRATKLASFNAYREHYGLKPYASFEDLTGDVGLAERLRDVYGHVDKLEWFVGLFAEAYPKREMMGELLKVMVANDAFTQALTNPLLSKNVFNEGTFGAEGLQIIKDTRTLAQVIARNTKASEAKLGFKTR